MPTPTATQASPLEQLIGDRMRIRTAGTPSLLMTALVGGGVGAAIGIASGDKALQYGALGAALGLAGSFAYAVYNAHSASEQALAEHQALLAAVAKPPAARVTRPPAGSPAQLPGAQHGYPAHVTGWWPGHEWRHFGTPEGVERRIPPPFYPWE